MAAWLGASVLEGPHPRIECDAERFSVSSAFIDTDDAPGIENETAIEYGGEPVPGRWVECPSPVHKAHGPFADFWHRAGETCRCGWDGWGGHVEVAWAQLEAWGLDHWTHVELTRILAGARKALGIDPAAARLRGLAKRRGVVR